MYNWDKPNQTRVKYKQFDSQNPTFSSSFLDQTLIKSHPPNSILHQPDHELCFLKNRGRSFEEDRMPPLQNPHFVDNWTEKKVNDKVIARRKNPSFSSPSSPATNGMYELDLQDTLFYSSSETKCSVVHPPKLKLPPAKFASIPPRPKIDLEKNDEEVIFVKTRSSAHKLYSNIKNLKQPVSPGARLTSLISSLFVKKCKTKKTGAGAGEREEWKPEQGSMCSSTKSVSRSCLSRNSSNKSLENGSNKRMVRFSPVGVILGKDSQPYNNSQSAFRSRGAWDDYDFEEQRMKLESEREKLQQEKQRDLEEIALDLLNGYWDSKLNVPHNHIVNNNNSKSVFRSRGTWDNHLVNDKVNQDDDDDNDDGMSCSSSDLFELEHLSLIGDDELPVYENTHFDYPKIM